MKSSHRINSIIAAGMIALPVFTSNVQAQTGESWRPDLNPTQPSDNLWSTAANWNPNGVPVSGYLANVNNSAPCVVNGVAGGCQVKIGENATATLVVTNGGDLTAGDAGFGDLDGNGWTGIGLGAGNGTVVVGNGGNLKCNYHLWIGNLSSSATATLIMNGGTASVTNNGNANWQLGTSTGPACHIYMNGGTFYVGKWDANRIQGTSQIDMAGGKIIVPGADRTGNINTDLAAGRFTAFGAPGNSGNITVDYNVTTPNSTTIMATGGGGGGGCATLSSFDNVGLDGYQNSWSSATIATNATNLAITATGYGNGFKGLTPAISTLSSLTLSLDVTLTAPDVMGPIVILQDGDGTQLQYAWYNTTAGNHVLTMPLSSGTQVAAGGTPGFDFTTVSAFQVQVDPEGVGGAYTAAFNNLAITGCGGGSAPQQKITGVSVSGGNVSIKYQTTSGFTYHLVSASSANTPLASWISVTGSATNGTGSEVTFTTPQSGNTQYYRSVSP